ncbi:MAG: PilZ domain-containing protein [Candidatus Angelobacter sp.]
MRDKLATHGKERTNLNINPQANGPEQRRWTRHRIDVRLRIAVPGIAGPVFGRGNTLSQGGMGAFIPGAIPLGTSVSIEVTFPYSASEVTLQAIVRSCEGFRYGLEFVNVEDDVRSVIVTHCTVASQLHYCL